MELYLALQPGRPAVLETRAAGEPDLAVEFSMVRAHGRTIAGGAGGAGGADAVPRAIIGVVPDEWVVAIGSRQLMAWERLTDDAEHAELTVLTTCRIWRFHAEGGHCSKSEAGRWALARDPSLTAVEQALRKRSGDPEATIAEDGIARLIAIVRREIANR
jgi:hypothetical protein